MGLVDCFLRIIKEHINNKAVPKPAFQNSPMDISENIVILDIKVNRTSIIVQTSSFGGKP